MTLTLWLSVVSKVNETEASKRAGDLLQKLIVSSLNIELCAEN